MNRILPFLILASILSLGALTPVSASAEVAVSVSVNVGPPPLPVYPQPFCPGPGFLWTPGYWAYGDVGYYWVPGVWVSAPVGLLWTPGYWGWREGLWWWHPGYWGPHVGFYGGIAYGYGYPGHGFEGGYWEGNEYFYNRSVVQVNTTYIHNTYEKEGPSESRGQRVSYNGGPGGITEKPTVEETRYAGEQHMAPTNRQETHEGNAMQKEGQRFSNNHGHPDVAASGRINNTYKGNGAVRSNPARNDYDYHPGPREMGAPRQPPRGQPRDEGRRHGGKPPAR